MQKVLIPYLRDNPQAAKLVSGWKTFDPKLGYGAGPEDHFLPGPTGQNAKGFTIYATNPSDIPKLQRLIDRELHERGLGLKAPPDSGNVDVITGVSNRVGVVRDHFQVAKDASGNVGVSLEGRLAQTIQRRNGGGQLDSQTLRAVERDSGIKPNSLGYDREGHLMLRADQPVKPRNGQVYIAEAGANGRHGQMTDRRALYALVDRCGLNPVTDIN